MKRLRFTSRLPHIPQSSLLTHSCVMGPNRWGSRRHIATGLAPGHLTSWLPLTPSARPTPPPPPNGSQRLVIIVNIQRTSLMASTPTPIVTPNHSIWLSACKCRHAQFHVPRAAYAPRQRACQQPNQKGRNATAASNCRHEQVQKQRIPTEARHRTCLRPSAATAKTDRELKVAAAPLQVPQSCTAADARTCPWGRGLALPISSPALPRYLHPHHQQDSALPTISIHTTVPMPKHVSTQSLHTPGPSRHPSTLLR